MNVEIDAIDLMAARGVIIGIGEGADEEIRSAIRAGLKYARKRFLKRAPDEYAILRSDVAKTLLTQYPTKQALLGRLESRSTIALPLAKFRFQVDWRRSGDRGPARQYVSTAVLRGSSLTLLPGAFTAKMWTGHVGIWRRLPGTKSKGGKEKIHEFSAISEPKMLESRRVMDMVIPETEEVLEKEYLKAVERAVDQADGRSRR